jgi:hypothetical protein
MVHLDRGVENAHYAHYTADGFREEALCRAARCVNWFIGNMCRYGVIGQCGSRSGLTCQRLARRLRSTICVKMGSEFDRRFVVTAWSESKRRPSRVGIRIV